MATPQDFLRLADLIDAYIAANEVFVAEHGADYNSAACHAVLEELQDEWIKALREFPREVSGALRAAGNILANANRVLGRE